MKLSHLALAVTISLGVVAVSMNSTERVALTSTAPTPVVHFEAEDYTAGATSWTNRISGQSGGVAPTGGMGKTSSGVSAVEFTGKSSSNSDRITGTIGSTSSKTRVTVEMWIRLKDDGSSQYIYGSMLFSWSGSPHYNVYHYKHGVGFNTISSELYGINGTSFVNEWKHLTFVMVSGASDADQKIYVDGVLQNLTCNPSVTQLPATSCSYPSKRVFNSNGDFLFMDNGFSPDTWNARADVGMLRIYDRELTSAEVLAAFDSSKNNGYLDTSGPSVTSATVPTSPSGSRTLTYTLNFSESTFGIAASDFSNSGTATGCTFAPSATSGVSVQVVVTCASDGTVVLQLGAHSVTDAFTNTGPGSTWSAASVSIDSTTATTTPVVATTTVMPSNSATVPDSTPIQTPQTNSSLSQDSVTVTIPSRATNRTTTTQARVVPAATTTTTSSTTTTTIAPMTSVAVPQFEQNGAGMEIDGKQADVEVTRLNDQIFVDSPTVSTRLKIMRRNGGVAPLGEQGQLKGNPGDSVVVALENLQQDSFLEVQMHSEPVLLGRTSVGSNGAVEGSYEIPDNSSAGAHSFVIVGVDRLGQDFTLATSLSVSENESSPGVVTVLIAVPLLGAVGTALFLPAVIRRRRQSVL